MWLLMLLWPVGSDLRTGTHIYIAPLVRAETSNAYASPNNRLPQRVRARDRLLVRPRRILAGETGLIAGKIARDLSGLVWWRS